jgi:bacterioferritin (cytochrome b1)
MARTAERNDKPFLSDVKTLRKRARKNIGDPTTRRMLEGILTVEEEHTNDMHDLLVAHQGKPMLRD